MNHRYFGTYHRFTTASKAQDAALMSADNLVGDRYELVLGYDEGVHTAQLRNRFGALIGGFDEAFARDLSVFAARDMTLCAILSFVAYTNENGKGCYWGEAAVIAYDPALTESFESFIASIRENMTKGKRLAINLDDSDIARIVETDGTWLPSKNVNLLKVEKDTVITKNCLSMTDKLVELGRARNVGCLVVSWALLLVFAALVIYAISRLFT